MVFYMKNGQGAKLKFCNRDLMRNNRKFSFRDQVKDNMFWSMGSGVSQLTLFQVITMWLMANDYAPTITISENRSIT